MLPFLPRRMAVLTRSLAGLLLLAGAVIARAEVKLPQIFSEHAVLQKSPATAVWGWAKPGEKVTVSFGAVTQTAVTGADGRWQVALDLSKAGMSPSELAVEGSNRLVVADVIVGEVWLSSGQSNMQLPLSATTDAGAEAARSKNANLRWFLAESRGSFVEPQKDLAGHWLVAGPETSMDCSAVAYYFGKKISGDLKCPVGLILTAVGGVTIQAWMSQEGLTADDAIKAAMAGQKPKKMRPILIPSFYFNQMINPLAALTFRGVLWYQGESHFSQGPFYRVAFPALIRDWRRHFGKADLPFYFCQLPNLDQKTAGAGEGGWVAEIREAQDFGLREKNTGEAVLIDVGGEDLHPPDKAIVGQRLAALAEAGTYGLKVEAEGPRFQSVKIEGGKMVVTFAHGADGLVTHPLPQGVAPNALESKVQGFAICGADGNWAWGSAEIAGATVTVSSPKVTAPVEVRYAWSNNPTCNLFNKAGLPAAPFWSRK